MHIDMHKGYQWKHPESILCRAFPRRFWRLKERIKLVQPGVGPHLASGGGERLPGSAALWSQMWFTPSSWVLPSGEVLPCPFWAAVQSCPSWLCWAKPHQWANILVWPCTTQSLWPFMAISRCISPWFPLVDLILTP